MLFSWMRAARSLLLCAIALVAVFALSASAQTVTGVILSQPALFPVEPSIAIQCTNCATGNASVLFAVAGDFNGDGIVDLAAVVQEYNGATTTPYIVVLLGVRGAAPTQVLTALPSSCSVSGVAAADLNNDKKLDLLLTCSQGYVASALGNGNGGFATPVLSAVPSGNTIAIADFNGDGLPDLAYPNNANYPTFGFSIALDNGGGKFGNPTFYATPGFVAVPNFQIGSGDFNGDGKQDLILGGATGSAYLLGNGDGTFGPPQLLASNVGPFVVADFNHDGFSDLAYSNGTALVLILGSSIGLAGPGVSTPAPNSAISQLFAGDLTGKGTLDVVAANSPNGYVSTLVFLANGTSGFSAATSYATPAPLALADLNGDGILDIAGAGPLASVSFSPGNGDGTFAALPNTLTGVQTRTGTGALPPEFIAADMNGDGLTDAVLQDHNGNPLVFLATGDGRFVATPNALPVSTPPAFGSIAVAADFKWGWEGGRRCHQPRLLRTGDHRTPSDIGVCQLCG